MLTRSAKSGNKLSTFSTNFKQNMELRERCKVRLWIPKTVQRSVAAIESAAPAHGAPKASSAEKTQHPNTKRPDIRCEVFDPKDGLKIRCTECNLTMAYGRWSRHVDKNITRVTLRIKLMMEMSKPRIDQPQRREQSQKKLRRKWQ